MPYQCDQQTSCNKWGFVNDEARQSKATEYAKSNGAWVGDNGCSYWWLRSPDPNSLNCLYGVGNLGNLYDYYGVYGAKTVVSPALWINI